MSENQPKYHFDNKFDKVGALYQGENRVDHLAIDMGDGSTSEFARSVAALIRELEGRTERGADADEAISELVAANTAVGEGDVKTARERVVGLLSVIAPALGISSSVTALLSQLGS